jgi:hypothetical protein
MMKEPDKPQISTLVLGCLLVLFWSLQVTAQSELPVSGTAVSPQASLMESFARLEGTNPVYSVELGRLYGHESTAVFSAVILENDGEAVLQMSGIRLDLENGASKDRIYLPAGELSDYRQSAIRIEQQLEKQRVRALAPRSVQGTERCWQPHPAIRVLCISYVMEPHVEALLLGAFMGESFEFPATDLARLIELFSQGMKILAVSEQSAPANPIDLPEQDLELIIASSVEHFPELAASKGVKAAGYTRSYDNRSAWVIFTPYEFTEAMSHTLMVDCERTSSPKTPVDAWRCDRSRSRSYLSIPQQDKHVVISGDYNREEALSLITAARKAAGDSVFSEDLHWTVVIVIRKPSGSFIRLRNDQGEDARELAFTLMETRSGQGDMLLNWCTGDAACEGSSG